MSNRKDKAVTPKIDLAALGLKIREAHKRRTKVDLVEGIDIGRMMAEARPGFEERAEFFAWINKTCDVGQSMAYRYLAVFEKTDGGKNQALIDDLIAAGMGVDKAAQHLTGSGKEKKPHAFAFDKQAKKIHDAVRAYLEKVRVEKAIPPDEWERHLDKLDKVSVRQLIEGDYSQIVPDTLKKRMATPRKTISRPRSGHEQRPSA